MQIRNISRCVKPCALTSYSYFEDNLELELVMLLLSLMCFNIPMKSITFTEAAEMTETIGDDVQYVRKKALRRDVLDDVQRTRLRYRSPGGEHSRYKSHVWREGTIL